MSAVFSHGRLRLYLLKLLAEGPRHGYELIRLLENQFLGLYAPSAGTIYPRLARMEADGLVSHTQAGGRKVYEITGAGRAELDARAGELAALESEINASVADLSTIANEVEQGVRGSVRDIKRELREATREARATRPRQRDWWAYPPPPAHPAPPERPAAPPPAPSPAPSSAPPGANGAAGELEQKASQILDEVRRLARTNKASAETLRATVVILDGALDQVRRLLG
jgi:DNA-binding PadR family transcriptional regulator